MRPKLLPAIAGCQGSFSIAIERREAASHACSGWRGGPAGLKHMADIQAADLFNTLAATAFEKPTDARAEGDIVHEQAAHLARVLVFDDQKAPVERRHDGCPHFLEDADLALGITIETVAQPMPCGRPATNTSMRQQWMVP